MFSKSTPLWMPRGSVRSILALGFAIGFIVGVFTLPGEQVAIIGSMTGMIVKSYFDGREPAEGNS